MRLRIERIVCDCSIGVDLLRLPEHATSPVLSRRETREGGRVASGRASESSLVKRNDRVFRTTAGDR